MCVHKFIAALSQVEAGWLACLWCWPASKSWEQVPCCGLRKEGDVWHVVLADLISDTCGQLDSIVAKSSGDDGGEETKQKAIDQFNGSTSSLWKC